MAYPSQINYNPDTASRVLAQIMALDEADWAMSDVTRGPVSQQTQELFKKTISHAESEYQYLIGNLKENKGPLASDSSLDHLNTKINRLKTKYNISSSSVQSSLQVAFFQAVKAGEILPRGLPTSTSPTQPIVQPQPLAKRNISFNISQVQEPSPVPVAQSAPSVSLTLNRISFLLRNNNEQQALKEFQTLPHDVKQSIFSALWTVRGKPMPGNPIADSNFGEVSFFNLKSQCSSTSQQKACAVEFVTTENSIREMISLLKQDKFEEAKAIFLTLPSQIQGSIYGKHWEVCGKPGRGHPMHHNDFGKVSFLKEEQRCDVSCEKRAEALNAYLPELLKSSAIAQELVPTEIESWKGIDFSRQAGQQKNEAKKASIHAFSAKIIRAFFGEKAEIKIPNVTHDSCKALAAAYVASYPFLKPFLLQLENTLHFDGEKLPNLPQSAQESRKSSVQKDPQLNVMNFDERKQYRLNIMNDTLDTLQKGYYINSQGNKVTLNLDPSIQSLELFTKANCQIGQHPGSYKTQLFLDNKDCLSVARDCAERGLNPIVLDAASNNKFGGGYKDGAGAQEEYMCRASGLCIAADPTQNKQQKDFYPLDKNGDEAGLYVAHVPVFRGEENQGYPYRDQPFETAVGIIAAYNFNTEHQRKNGVQNPLELTKKNNELRIPDAQIEGTKAKIRTFLTMAEAKGHDVPIFVALGCGAFCTPPLHMCDLIMQVIVQEFPNSFKEIHFSIIDDHNTGQAHNPEGNYTPFKRMIGYFTEPMQKVGMTFIENK